MARAYERDEKCARSTAICQCSTRINGSSCILALRHCESWRHPLRACPIRSAVGIYLAVFPSANDLRGSTEMPTRPHSGLLSKASRVLHQLGMCKMGLAARTKRVICVARMLKTKQVEQPRKKHDNLPMWVLSTDHKSLRWLGSFRHGLSAGD